MISNYIAESFSGKLHGVGIKTDTEKCRRIQSPDISWNDYPYLSYDKAAEITQCVQDTRINEDC